MDSSSAIVQAASEITEKYKKILLANGITDEVSEVLLEVDPADLQGEGMGSQQTYVTVKFIDCDVKPLNLFVKANTHDHADFHEPLKSFEKEARFFTEYVPAIKEFWKAKGQDGLVDFYPECYYGDGKMLVFENLVSKGYFMLKKRERQGLESARLALTTLAKHHAISHAFIHETGGPGEFFKKFPNLDFEAFSYEKLEMFIGSLVENGISTIMKIIEKSNVDNKEDALAALQAHVGKGYQVILNTLKYQRDEEKVLTLNHGDYWNNNMMFLRDATTNKLHSHIMYDLQMTRYNSPALDVGNFMYTSMKPEVRRAHLEELLRLYHEVLLDTANKLGNPIQLSYEEFYHLFRRKFLYGFWFSIWLAVDIAYKVINEMDNDGKVDASDFATRFDSLIQKWVDENPEESTQEARNLVELMKEYSSLVLK